MLKIVFILFYTFCLFSQEAEKPTYEKALSEFVNLNYQKSIETIRELILLNGTKYEYHYLAAHDYWNLNNYKSAMNHFQAAIKFKPEDPKAYIELVKLYENSKNYKQALIFCESSIELFPNENELRLLQSGLFLKFGKIEMALASIEKLKQTNPDDYKPILLEANIYFAQKDLEKTEFTLKWASTLSPNNPIIQNNLSLVYEQFFLNLNQKNKPKEANQKLELALNEINLAAKNSNLNNILENQKRISSYKKN